MREWKAKKEKEATAAD